ncbi:4-amino-4-deoxy-L-arabinose transferase [Lewinellaceae bacterium SD302]|nr:4-amino-4-deoxy-L-arabinose transferase [Lewinellaceae bacterium SD302]
MIINKSTFKLHYWLLGWLILNLIQAFFTPLDADEAYYWMYAGELDWGYFDHPPSVAALIALGRDWLPGELGLRFGHVLAGIGTAWLIWELVDRPKGALAWMAALVITIQPMLQVYGFIATPDGPLLFFTALLLWQYKKFLATPSIGNGLILGAIMAALLYSKYHGVLLILFIALPNLRWLIRQPGAWLAAGFGALLYVPHLYWQFAHDYPSFRYHLSGRNDPYQLKYTTEFLLNQLLIFNPFLLYHYFRSLGGSGEALTSTSPEQRFYRACRWLIFLTLGFFLYSTSKGGTEAQWTAMLCIPLAYILIKNLEKHPEWFSLIWKLGLVSMGLFLLARVFLMLPANLLPVPKPLDPEPWVDALVEIAENRPVVFENSYRDPSLYQFYTGHPATTFTDVAYRPNQYDIWRRDTFFQGKEVLLVGKEGWQYSTSESFTPQTKRLRTAVIHDFKVAKFVRLNNAGLLPDTLKRGQPLKLELYARNLENFPLELNGRMPIQVYAIFQEIDGEWKYIHLKDIKGTAILPGDPRLLFEGEITVPEGLPPTEHLLQFGLGYSGMPPLRGQSELMTVQIR